MNVVPYQWVTLVIIAAATALRLPSAIRGRGRDLAFALGMLTLAVALSIPAIYVPVDGALGGFSLTNLILRFLLYGAFFTLGLALVESYSKAARKAVVGWPGLLVLGFCLAVIVAMFIISGNKETSTGMLAHGGIDAVLVYQVAGYAYPAYIAAVLLGGTYKAAGALDGLLKLAAVLLLIALAGMVVLPVLQGIKVNFTALAIGKLIIQYTALNLIAISLSLNKIESLRHPRSLR